MAKLTWPSMSFQLNIILRGQSHIEVYSPLKKKRDLCVNKIERYFVNENFVYCYDIHNSAYTVKIKACYFLNIFKKLLCLCENMHILRIFLENLNRLHARNSVFFSDIAHNYLTFCFQKKCLQEPLIHLFKFFYCFYIIY